MTIARPLCIKTELCKPDDGRSGGCHKHKSSILFLLIEQLNTPEPSTPMSMDVERSIIA